MTSLDRYRSTRSDRRHRRGVACSPSLGAADGPLPLEPRLLLAAADPTPIPTLFTPSPSFTTGQHIVSTTVFNWFTSDSGQLSGPWRPVEGRQNWTGDVAFWERQLKDMMDAGIDLLYVIEIPDHDQQRINLFAAANDLRSQGYNVPKIAPFLDPVITWSIQPPIDVATAAGKDTWVAQYEKWYDEYYSVNADPYANDYLGQMNGKPILDSWHNLPDMVANLSSLTRADVEGRLQSYYGAGSIFGHGIYMVGTGLNPWFPAFTDERLAQFEVTNYYQPVTYKGITTAMVKAGYWDQNVRNPGSFLPRDGGSHYINAWAQVNANPAITHVNVESWNEYDEGSGIYAADPGPPFILPGSGNTNTDTWSSTNNPREYIDDTAAGARTFNSTPDYGAQFLWNDLPTTMQPGETRTVTVVVRNTGDLRWTGAAQFKLGQEELKDPAVFGVGRYTIDDQSNEIPQYGGIFRGRPITFQFQLQAPTQPGVYPLHFQMVQENVTWFGDELPVTITVGNPAPQITAKPAGQVVNAGQNATFTVAATGQSLAYQWQHLVGATWGNVGINSPSLTVTSAVASDAGSYRVIVSNAYGSATSNTATLTVNQAPAGLAFDSGGGAAGSFAADADVSGGSVFSTGDAISTAGVANAAPQAVYQTERYGNFTYTIPNLTPGASYTVRLHFAEIYWNAAGQRIFNVAINGQQVLSNFDIYAAAGGKDKALVETFAATADAQGRITIAYTTVRDNAKSSGIEIIPTGTPFVGAPLAGLEAEFFDFTSSLSALPDLTGRTADVTRVDANLNDPSTDAAWPGLDARFADTFASRNTGYLRVDTPGSYTLYLNSDDGSRLWLDGQLLIDNNGLHGMTEKSATVALSAGYHALRVEFFENIGGAGLVLSWSGPGIGKQVVPTSNLVHDATPQPGLVSEFFDSTSSLSVLPDLTGRSADVARVDAALNYPLTGAAWAGLDSRFTDTFASRHTGYLRVNTPGSYTLSLSSDDGSRLWLDGQLLIDNDGLHALVEKSATLTLSAGYHLLRVEFFENQGDAGLVLSWSGPGIAKQVIPASNLVHDSTPVPGLEAEFFDSTSSLSALPDLTGRTADVARTDANLNYSVTDSAWPGLDARFVDTFSARHTGFLRVDTPGSYTLSLNSDDGSRLWLDGQLLIDNNGLHGMTEKSATVTLSAGYHALRVEYFENTGGAGLVLSWSGPGIAKQVVPASNLVKDLGVSLT